MDSRILDKIDRLSQKEKLEITERLESFELSTHHELVIAIIDSVKGEGARENARSMRRELSKNTDNSLILVVAINDRHTELASTPSLHDKFTSESTENLLSSNFVPAMRAGSLVRAIIMTINAIENRILSPTNDSGPGKKPTSSLKRLLIILAAAIVLVIATHNLTRPRCPKCKTILQVRTITLIAATRSAEGLESQARSCKKCDFRDRKTFTVPVIEESTTRSSSSSFDNDGDWGSSSSSSSSDGGGGADW